MCDLILFIVGIPHIFTDNDHTEVSTPLSQFSGEDGACLRNYIAASRININIRDKTFC